MEEKFSGNGSKEVEEDEPISSSFKHSHQQDEDEEDNVIFNAVEHTNTNPNTLKELDRSSQGKLPSSLKKVRVIMLQFEYLQLAVLLIFCITLLPIVTQHHFCLILRHFFRTLFYISENYFLFSFHYVFLLY